MLFCVAAIQRLCPYGGFFDFPISEENEIYTQDRVRNCKKNGGKTFLDFQPQPPPSPKKLKKTLISQLICDNFLLNSNMLNTLPRHIYHVSFIKIKVGYGVRIGVQRYPPKTLTSLICVVGLRFFYTCVVLYQISRNPQRKRAKENGIFKGNSTKFEIFRKWSVLGTMFAKAFRTHYSAQESHIHTQGSPHDPLQNSDTDFRYLFK